MRSCHSNKELKAVQEGTPNPGAFKKSEEQQRDWCGCARTTEGTVDKIREVNHIVVGSNQLRPALQMVKEFTRADRVSRARFIEHKYEHAEEQQWAVRTARGWLLLQCTKRGQWRARQLAQGL